MRATVGDPNGAPTPSHWGRSILALAALLLCVATPAMGETSAKTGAETGTPHHGTSLFGSVAYPPDFSHFDYVNPDAPKGGTLRYGSIGSFDSLNPYIIKGDPAAGLALTYDRLMTDSLDEPASQYGLIAESISHPDDFSSATFELREAARFHDGEPVTAEDVIWSLETLKANHPFYAAYYANVAKSEALGPHTVKFTFSETGNRELPHIMGQLPVLPKHYWTAEGRDASKTTLEPPLTSGPYRIAKVVPGRSVILERVEDYWGKDLPVNVGENNFGEIRFEYFGDTAIALEAFKAGQLDLHIESSAKNWATAYDIPAVREGKIKLEEIASKNPEPMQAFMFNTRRTKFADPRVREAFNYALDFEWMNKNIFYNQYTRTSSYFPNSELAATGEPSEAERALLEPFRDELPDEVFGPAFTNPTTDGSGRNRQNLTTAKDLLAEAGWVVRDGKLVNEETGEPMEVEFLLVSPTFERVVSPYAKNLERLGVKVTQHTVDSAQYQNRVDSRDFDVIVGSFPQSLSPGNEQRDFWGCAAAKAPGSRNTIGVCEPAVEALIEKIIYAESREDLLTASRALDRVLTWNHYVVPQWFVPVTRVAYWSDIAHPEPMPDYGLGFPMIWWHTGSADGK